MSNRLPQFQTLPADQIEDVTAGLVTAGRLAETRFQDISESLQQAIAVLTRMTATFSSLHARLEGSDLLEATNVLSSAAAEVEAFAAVSRQDAAMLVRLAGSAGTMREPLSQMKKLAGEVGILAMNARVTAATMGDSGADFMLFAGDIRTSGQRTEDNLRLFGEELTQVIQDLLTARTHAQDLSAQHGTSMTSIPGRLAATVDAIAARMRVAAIAAATVTNRSRLMAERVGEVVVALQLGDITRQRIEHVTASLGLLAALRLDRPETNPWPDFDPGQRAVAAETLCQIAAAQLADTDADLKREGGHINALLRGLMADAADVVHTSHVAYADAGVEHGTSLDALEQHVREAHALISSLQSAHDVSYRQIETVLHSTQRLLGRIATVRSVEGEIHIMGLNTVLKCGRLGKQGRPLAVIAQALRECGKRTAGAANTMLTSLEQLMADAGALHDPARARKGAVMADVVHMIKAAQERLGTAQAHLKTALDELECDSAAVKEMLDAALFRFAARQEISDAVRRGGTVFAQLAGTIGANAAENSAVRTRVLAHIAASYTMDRERTAHRRITAASGCPAEAIDAPDQAELEDFLF
jgi:hypothetical protein